MPGHKNSVPESNLSEGLAEFFMGLKLPDDWQEQILEISKKPEANDVGAKRARLEDRKRRMIAAYLNGDIEDAEYQKLSARFKQETSVFCQAQDESGLRQQAR